MRLLPSIGRKASVAPPAPVAVRPRRRLAPAGQRPIFRDAARAELVRRVSDLQQAQRVETYAAAKTNRLTGDWSPAWSNINDIIGASSPTVRNRVRQLVRDFPYFGNAVNKLVDYTVGDAIVYQARVKDGDGKLNTKLNQQIEDAFRWWADEADIAGKLHYYEIMRLMKRQDVESGEFVLVKTISKNRNRYLPFCLQVFEADWLATTSMLGASTAAGDVLLEQGIEYRKATGEVLAYHFTDPDGWGKTIRIPAENVLHGFQTLRPGQLRGISPLAPGVLVAHSLHDFLGSEIDAAKMAAKYLAIVKTPNPLARQYGNTTTDTATGQKIETLESAIIEYLRPGEEIEIAKNPRPGENFTPFVKLVLCMFAVTTGVPYELVSGDYGGLNYTVLRGVRNDFSHQLRPIATRHVRQMAVPCVREFFESAWMMGRLDLPGYALEPRRYTTAAEYQPPGMDPIDPMRETRAAVDAIKALIRSPQEVVRARGRELEDVYREIQAAKEMAEQLGIAPQEISKALAGNPAAVMEDQE
ncbi:MAG: phage portal protein [Desulfobacteraceae bacterium]|nr:phage portal protein [Desulfobacteraceae bacterium]